MLTSSVSVGSPQILEETDFKVDSAVPSQQFAPEKNFGGPPGKGDSYWKAPLLGAKRLVSGRVYLAPEQLTAVCT